MAAPRVKADQQVAASAGESKREEKHSTFDLEPPIAGHQSFPKRFGGHGAVRLCSPYACFFEASFRFIIALSL
jgi:hypothetical protein